MKIATILFALFLPLHAFAVEPPTNLSSFAGTDWFLIMPESRDIEKKTDADLERLERSDLENLGFAVKISSSRTTEDGTVVFFGSLPDYDNSYVVGFLDPQTKTSRIYIDIYYYPVFIQRGGQRPSFVLEIKMGGFLNANGVEGTMDGSFNRISEEGLHIPETFYHGDASLFRAGKGVNKPE